MESNVQRNKRIAKNTLFLYGRMLLMMLVSLFTARIVLHALGATDLGIYNVIAGFVGLFSFVNTSLANSIQRFLNIALGKKNKKQLFATFSLAFWIHVVLAIVVLILLETIGIWFLYNKLNIPEMRLNAAFWLLQFAAITSALNITQTPFMASLIAREKMSVYAKIGLVDVFAKLLIVYLVWAYSGDRLIIYGFLWFIEGIFTFFLYRVYCVKKIEECRMIFMFDKILAKRIFIYTSWDFLKNLSIVISSQGVNVVLNIFLGPLVNAACGIADNVNVALMKFVGGFQVAANPQIVKLYAAKETSKSFNLATKVSYYSALIFMLFVIPLIINIEFVLKMWLGYGYPAYTGIFICIILLQNIFSAMTSPLSVLYHARGKLKTYVIYDSIVLILGFIILYILLKRESTPVIAYLVSRIPWILEYSLLIYLIKKAMGLGGIRYFSVFFVKVVVIFFLTFIPSYYLHTYLSVGWNNLILVSGVSFLIYLVSVYVFGLNHSERLFIREKIKENSLRIKSL